MAEPPEITRFRNTCLPLDTKYSQSESFQQFHRAHPKEELETIHEVHPGSDNEYKLTILSSFHTIPSLKIIYYNTKVQCGI